MKKIIIMFLLSFLFITVVSAEYTLTKKEKIISQKIAQSIGNKINSKNPLQKGIWEKKFQILLSQQKKDSRGYKILSEILQNIMKYDLNSYYNRHLQSFNIDKININNYWLNLHNKARKSIGLQEYSYDSRLNNTAIEWSYNNSSKGSMDHKRDYGDSFYDYKKIEKWFNNRGVNCKIKGRTTTSESIAQYGFYCSDSDCNDELKSSLNEIFSIYMNEKGMKYPANAHYKAIISPNISKIGLGITIQKSKDTPNYYEYYMATHYCTEFKS